MLIESAEIGGEQPQHSMGCRAKDSRALPREESPVNQVGKRYFCQVCGSEFIVTRGGDGRLECHGQPMLIREGATDGGARQ